MLLVVAESSGSSPGRAGYKMAVGLDGELCGSIGGGVMEVRLVEQAKVKSKNAKVKNKSAIRNPQSAISEQVHQKNSPHSSGMICSGRQTVIFKHLGRSDHFTVKSVIDAFKDGRPDILFISYDDFEVLAAGLDLEDKDFRFEKRSNTNFIFTEKIGAKNELFIVGGGHCALALSEIMSKMDFRISIFDDRPELNTLAKNKFADEITLIQSYDGIAEFIPSGSNIYVVVMTLGFKSDEIVIRSLSKKEFRYFGVLGSKAKMKTLLCTLEKDGVSKERLSQIRTPIGLPINSHTTEEIAISIAAEIISIKNS